MSFLSSEELEERRKKICLECDLAWKSVEYLEQCSLCFCFIRAKVKVLNSSCPAGKW